jgi:hypothetical protein
LRFGTVLRGYFETREWNRDGERNGGEGRVYLGESLVEFLVKLVAEVVKPLSVRHLAW